MGGCINFKFGRNSYALIQNNYFFYNYGDIGGVLDYDFIVGVAKTVENYFLDNIGYAFWGTGIGSAAVGSFRGTSNSLIHMYYDKEYFNWSENKATMISYGANIKIYGVNFYRMLLNYY